MVKAIVNNVVTALKDQPLVIALLALNVLYMAGGFFLFREERASTRTAITQLLDRCTK